MLKATLEQWRMFQAVIEHGGFNQASVAIHKSQSSIHHAVHKLEQSLNVELVKTQGRKTIITEPGELMLRRARYLLDEAGKIEAVAKTLSEGIESQLRVAVDEIFPQELLYQVLERVSAQYPQLRIELVESILTGANELLDEAKVDIAISPFPMETSISEELCQIEFIAVASPQHALHATTPNLSLEDLKSHRQIVVRDSAMAHQRDEGWLGANQRWTVSHMRTSIDMIVNGLGFAWLPKTSISSELSNGKLKALPLSYGGSRTTPLHLVFSDSDSLGPAAQVFIGELRHRCLTL